MIQTAEGALDEVNTLLNKARGLALHAANEGANDNNQLVADQTELDNILSSVDRIAGSTQFGTKKLLDGTMSSFRSNHALVGSAQTGNHYSEGLKDASITRGYHSLLITHAGSASNLFVGGGTADIMTGGTLDAMSGTEQFQKSFTVAVNGSQISVASGTTKADFVNQLNTIGKTMGFAAIVVTQTAAADYYTGVGGYSAGNVTTGGIVLMAKDVGAGVTLSLNFVSGATGATSLDGTLTAGTDIAAQLLVYSGAVGGTATTGNTAVALAQSGNSQTLVSTVAGQGYRINLNGLVGVGSGVTTITGANSASGLLLFGAIDGMTSGATFQIGANAGQTASVSLASAKSLDLGMGVSATYKSLGQLNGSLTSGNATEALKVIDKAIDDVTVMRGKLGAFQANTLETNISSLKIASENLTAAESSIRDVDFAEESAQFTKNNILVQSATAMLAQANQLPNNVLKLLG
jgi:flagellin